MPIGGKLNLKGGNPWTSGVSKKKGKKKPQQSEAADDAEAEQQEAGEQAMPASLRAVLNADARTDAPAAVQLKTGQTYEAEFELEMERAETGKQRVTPWGSGYGRLPEGGKLHGYDRVVKGVTASERLDLRAARSLDNALPDQPMIE